MIEVRDGFWETNSSSCHVFIYNPNSYIHIPKTLTLGIDSDKTLVDTFFNDVRWSQEDLNAFLRSLINLGVETVICSDHNIEKRFENIKMRRSSYRYCGVSPEELRYLFSTSTVMETYDDYMVEEQVKKDYGEDAEYWDWRLS